MTPANSCVLVVLALLLAGCQLRSDVAVAVASDGSGTFAVTLSADRQLRRLADDVGVDPLADLAGAVDRLRGWEVSRQRASGGEPVVTVRTAFDDPEDLHRVTSEFSEGLAAAEIAPLGPFRLAVTDDTLILTGMADLRVRAAVRELGLTRPAAREALAEGLRLRITAQMPGEVLATNADLRPDARTVQWTVGAGRQRALRVQAERPWTLGRLVRLLWPYILIVLLAGAAILVAHRLRGLRRWRSRL